MRLQFQQALLSPAEYQIVPYALNISQACYNIWTFWSLFKVYTIIQMMCFHFNSHILLIRNFEFISLNSEYQMVSYAGLSPPVKYFYWPFQGGTSFVDYLCFFSIYVFFLSCVCYFFVCVCFFVPCGHLLGKGWPLDSRLWFLNVS